MACFNQSLQQTLFTSGQQTFMSVTATQIGGVNTVMCDCLFFHSDVFVLWLHAPNGDLQSISAQCEYVNILHPQYTWSTASMSFMHVGCRCSIIQDWRWCRRVLGSQGQASWHLFVMSVPILVKCQETTGGFHALHSTTRGLCQPYTCLDSTLGQHFSTGQA